MTRKVFDTYDEMHEFVKALTEKDIVWSWSEDPITMRYIVSYCEPEVEVVNYTIDQDELAKDYDAIASAREYADFCSTPVTIIPNAIVDRILKFVNDYLEKGLTKDADKK